MHNKTKIWLIIALCLIGAFTSSIKSSADDIRQVALTANDLIYDPGTQEIYASIPSSAGGSGNSITPINPVTGALGASVFVGSEPHLLTHSDDNQFLYVGLDGASAVRRFDLATQTAGLQFSIETPYQAEDLAVPPGQPNAVCIVRKDPRYSPHFARTVIYDDGVARAQTTNGQDTIAFSASPTRLYAYNSSSSPSDFDRINVSSSGLDPDTEDQNFSLISGFGLQIKFNEGLVFVNNGEVIDPEAQTILGTFSGAGYGVPFAVFPGDRRAFFLTSDGSTHTLRAYDTTTFLPAGTLDIPGVTGSPGSLIRWGANGLAFKTDHQVFLIRTSLVPSRPTRFDFDGDRRNDLLWHNTRTGQTLVWDMNDLTVHFYGDAFATAADTDWTVAAVADINGDGHPDLLWQNRATGQVLFWLMGGTGGTHVLAYGSPVGTVADTHWHVVSMADFNGDGHPDILWQNSASGEILVWTMNGMQVVRSGTPLATTSDTNWQIVGTADFDGDGRPDFVWENRVTGAALVWNMGGASGTTALHYGQTIARVADTAWHIVGTGDVNGDGHPDLVWQNKQTGQVLRWLMGGSGGTTVLHAGKTFVTVPDTHWQITGVH